MQQKLHNQCIYNVYIRGAKVVCPLRHSSLQGDDVNLTPKGVNLTPKGVNLTPKGVNLTPKGVD